MIQHVGHKGIGFRGPVVQQVIGGQIGREAVRAALSPPKSSQQDIESKLIEGLKTAAIEINKKCPMMVDEENRLDKATVGPGDRAVHHNTFPKYNSEDIDSNLIRTNLRAEVMQKVCSSESMKKSLQ